MVEDYDLQGMTVISHTLSWSPHVNVGQCDERGYNCENSGLFSDLGLMMSRQLGAKLG